MKNRFQRLSKQEKKQAVKEYIAEDPNNKNYMSTLTRMKVLGIIGFIYGTLALLADIFILNVSIWTYLVDAIVMIFTVFLLVQRSRIFNGTMNAYVIERDLKTKKVVKKEEVEMPKKKTTTKTTAKKASTTTKSTTKKTTTKKSTTAKKSTTKKSTTKKEK